MRIERRVSDVLAFGFAAIGSAHAQTTTLASVATGGAQATNNVQMPVLSADGRWVLFQSGASNLVPGDTNAVGDYFVRDLVAGTTERVSVATGGTQGNNASGYDGPAAISADGRFVVFRSDASNLVTGDTNGRDDIFLRDRVNGTTERVSVTTSGAQGNGFCLGMAISRDGRFVAFVTSSALVPVDTNSQFDVYVRDRSSGTTDLVSVSTAGGLGDGLSTNPAISDDGRYVAFNSLASMLVMGDTNLQSDIFVRDRLLATTERVSVSGLAQEANGFSDRPSISADGRFVAFESNAPDLVPGDTNARSDVFVRDRAASLVERVNVATGGSQSLGALLGRISGDGRFVVFFTDAPDLVANDTNGWNDGFLRDRLLGTTERVTLAADGTQVARGGHRPWASDDGRYVAFESESASLVPGDVNGFHDIFVRDRGTTPPTAYCFGDGSGTACPCGTGPTGTGCPNSTSTIGAHLAAGGTASLASDTLVLVGAGMPNGPVLYLQGTTQLGGGAGVTFGDGLSCLGGTIVRLGTKTNVNGRSLYPGPGDASISVVGQISTPGVRTYQAWYRNDQSFCTLATFNGTNGVEVNWTL